MIVIKFLTNWRRSKRQKAFLYGIAHVSGALRNLTGQSVTKLPYIVYARDTEYKQIFDALNKRFFYGQLPYPHMIVIADNIKDENTHGLFFTYPDLVTFRFKSSLSSSQVYQVMLHEMIHFSAHIANPDDCDHESSEYRSECRRIAELMKVRIPMTLDDFKHFPDTLVDYTTNPLDLPHVDVISDITPEIESVS